MNCRKISNLLSAYMDGELPGVEQLMIRDHLKCCDSCREDYESLLFTKRLLCGLKVKHPAESLEGRIRTSIAVEQNAQQPKSPVLRGWAALAAWWQVLAYGQKLRYSAVFAASSILFAAITITPTSLRRPEAEIGLQSPVTYAGVSAPSEREMLRPGLDGRFRSVVPTYHDPSTNPPTANGSPLLIPVSADDAGSGRR